MNTTPFSSKSYTHKLSLWNWTAEDITGLTRVEISIIERKVTEYLHNVMNRRDY